MADEQQSHDFTVVAVGASAGGLEALERLFTAMPPTVPAAFVVIQHLSTAHKSMMVDLLARHTQLPVHTAKDKMRLTPGHVHLIPASHNLSLEGARLRLIDKAQHGLNLPIDRFFTDAAEELGPRLVAVVLSGTGSDGARGARVVNEHGGLVLAQSPESAKFDGMPRSVMATGMVDEVLSPTQLADRIVRFATGRTDDIDLEPEPLPDEATEPLDEIVNALSVHTGIDFRSYKPGTLIRRIDRRIAARRLPSRNAYLDLLLADPKEVDGLYRDVLIGVTSFFRDTEMFEKLRTQCIPGLLEGLRIPGSIRVWVAGCATGEEAYSIAILLEEAMREARVRHRVKIFATDVDPDALSRAQAGRYPRSAVAELGEGYAERYFDEEGDWLVVKEEIRRHIVFARHDLTNDPPFTRVDLVSCRNTLIYLKQRVQEQVLRRFQFALGVGGWLFLGSSESLGSADLNFEVVDSKAKLFTCVRRLDMPLDVSSRGTRPPGSDAIGPHARRKANVDAGRRMLMQQYVPLTVMVDGQRNVQHVFGDPGAMLQVPSGSATSDITRMLAPRVGTVAMTVLLRVLKTPNTPTQDGEVIMARSAMDADGVAVRVEGRRLRGNSELVLLSFAYEQASPVVSDASVLDSADMSDGMTARVRELEDEVALTRASLQSSIEELEASNEELQAANEELIASNEELQSTNEELQSVNEELYTVNAEHQEKIEILHKLNADLDVMAKATGIPMLFLDRNLCITRFTPAITEFVALTSSDVGRPLEHFTVRLEAPWLMEALGEVAETGLPFQREVASLPWLPDGGGARRFLIKVMPYESGKGGGPGVVMTMLDITAVREARAWQSVIDGLVQHIAILDEQGIITNVNRSWNDFARRNGDPHLRHTSVGSNYLEATQRDDSATGAEAFEGLKAVLEGRKESFRLEYPCHSPSHRRFFVMDAVRLDAPGGGAVVSHMETTPWVVGHDT